jgi:hypothetical protein
MFRTSMMKTPVPSVISEKTPEHLGVSQVQILYLCNKFQASEQAFTERITSTRYSSECTNAHIMRILEP